MEVHYRTRNWYGHIYDDKRRALRSKHDDGNVSTTEAERGRTKIRWLDRERVNREGTVREGVYDPMHNYRRTSTHKKVGLR